MIRTTKGNLIEADTEALVNTVNCVGVMGKGIALQFKKAFPDNFKAYERACRAHEVRPGRVLVYETGTIGNPRLIFNFPTKRHWKGKAHLADIRSGLQALVAEVHKRGVRSIAVPPLGCGLGGLDWNDVKPLIESAFATEQDVSVHLYEPVGTPAAKEMPVRTQRPGLTVARALFLRVMKLYRALNYRLTLLEIQKLAYFLQVAGEPLRLKYTGHHYGPYAHNLNKVLEQLEGHFIRGYGDTQGPDVEIELMPQASAEADLFLSEHLETQPRLARVGKLIEGFETPYGMELLSSVHWVATHGASDASTLIRVQEAIQDWSPRKAKLMKPAHIELAWTRLRDQGWLDAEVTSAR